MLRAGTTGATPWSRLIDQRDVRVLRLQCSPCPTYSCAAKLLGGPAGTEAAGPSGIWRSSKALALLRARCLVLKEHCSRYSPDLVGPLRPGQILGCKKPLTHTCQRQTTVPRIHRRIDRLGTLPCELFD